MATYTKSFSAENPTELLRRLIGVRGATVRGVTRGTPRGTKVTFAETATGVLATIEAPSIEVAQTIVGKLKAIATAEPVLSTYVPSSTRRELIGMLIGKRGVVLTSIGRKHNVKIFYHDEEGRFSIEGISRADVHAAHTALHTRDERAVLKLAERAAPAVISLDDVPPPPPTLSLTRQNAMIDLDESVPPMPPLTRCASGFVPPHMVRSEYTAPTVSALDYQALCVHQPEHTSPSMSRMLVANVLGVPVESVNPESVAGFANKDAAMGSPAWVAYHLIGDKAPSLPTPFTLPTAAAAAAVADILDVPPAIVREVAGEVTGTVFVSDEEKASRDRTAFIHTVCGMFQAAGKFTALTPETSAHLMAAAERIADEQLARDVDWDEMVAGAVMGHM